MDRTIIAIVTLLLVITTGCDDKRVYHSYAHTPLAGWEKNDSVAFDVAPLQETCPYIISLGLRLSDEYPFRNLNLVVKQTIIHGNQGRTITDTISCNVVDKQGSMRGNGITLYQYDMPLRKLTYQRGDSLHFTIRHNMKREVLPGIADVGILLKKY